MTLRAPDFRLDVDELEAAVTDRTTRDPAEHPAQPDRARASTREELDAVAEVAPRHDLVVVTDEVYEHLTFDDHEHVPIATLPGMFERTRDHLELGQDVLVHRLEDRLGHRSGRPGRGRARARRTGCPTRRAHRSSPPSRTRWTTRRRFHEQLRDDLQKRRDFLCDGLDALGLDGPRARRAPTSSPPTCRSLGHADGKAFCAAMAERAKVVAIPNQVFYDDDSTEGRHLVRWAFCKEQDVLEEGMRRLRGADLRPEHGSDHRDHQTGGLPCWSGGAGGADGGGGGGEAAAGRRTGPAADPVADPGRALRRPVAVRGHGEPGARPGGEQAGDRGDAGDDVQQRDREREGRRPAARRRRSRPAGSAPSCAGAR